MSMRMSIRVRMSIPGRTRSQPHATASSNPSQEYLTNAKSELMDDSNIAIFLNEVFKEPGQARHLPKGSHRTLAFGKAC
jgi:hypothetical protein